MITKIIKLTSDFKLLAGKYWIGDPYYVYPSHEWKDFCENLDKAGCYNYHTPEYIDGRDGLVCYYDNIQTDFLQKALPFVFVATAYGNGCYALKQTVIILDEEIGVLPVDSGSLSIVPVKLVDMWRQNDPNKHFDDHHGCYIETAISDVVASKGNFDWDEFNVNTQGEDN